MFNRIQINSDRLLVANGQAMQKILEAMEADANLGRAMAAASHTLSKEMKADSVAMKTVGKASLGVSNQDGDAMY